MPRSLGLRRQLCPRSCRVAADFAQSWTRCSRSFGRSEPAPTRVEEARVKMCRLHTLGSRAARRVLSSFHRVSSAGFGVFETVGRQPSAVSSLDSSTSVASSGDESSSGGGDAKPRRANDDVRSGRAVANFASGFVCAGGCARLKTLAAARVATTRSILFWCLLSPLCFLLSWQR